MKKRNLFLVAVLATVMGVNAQTAENKTAFGLSIGKTEYNGELGNGIFNFKKTPYIFGGISLARYLNASFDLGLQGSYGAYGYYNGLTYADKSGAIHYNNVLANKYETSLYLHYKLNNGYILSKTAKLSPFVEAGGGLAWYKVVDQNGISQGYRVDNSGKDVIIPVGAGLKYQITNGFGIQYKYVYNFTNNDKRDHLKTSSANDAYGQHVFSLVFSLNCACKKDADHDGVADKDDQCPNTPEGVQVDSKGCPFDTDGDGVADYQDKCPNTPAGAKVDATGCPLDSDGDGVADYQDKCPNTPAGAKVDANGCPIDSDGDGVADFADKCPNTPAGTKVDAKGCPLDSDGDGVIDAADQCPNTPAGVKVDAKGCPLDTDGDGIADYMDKCPKVPGIAANKGCPEVKAETKKIFTQALQGIQFETNSDVIKKSSNSILDKVVKVMKDNPEYNLEINGHSDNTGNANHNLELSQKRADAVKAYLVKAGVDGSKLTAKGFGQTVPVADNKTAAGRAKNRRVEFKVNF